ncbi:carbamate kinase [Candidatus Caldarchaeum subterraneum]|uniref:Carbamate kinase n=1 Tax=Caldiarchaeum subterraneum TaxID=311458 RepID=E6N9I0_CALS0|nr:carbamate kinase [Candidatus Caldarchaeum subterraneum]BAJ49021.1 carbamate kinase [Candidatus Caldarchaeum subterraneum]BAJ51570.1 carbamate kinase [Candidatus Caldarchaeum subterraneum]
MDRSELIVVALGGNALLRRGDKGSFEEQYKNVGEAAKYLADIVEAGHRLVITHGNGPQVGATLLRHDAGQKLHNIPAFPMDACGAETQGFIGYIIQQNLRNELKRRGIDKYVITVVTRVIVDKNDPAFSNPTKPIGPFYKKEEMEKIKAEHPEYVFVEDKARGGWRRVVPSPDPKIIAERHAIRKLVDEGFIVVASGGGGIPIVEENGKAYGVEAVIDKDLAGERLAELIGADRFIILTDVDGAYLNFGKPDQKKLEKVSAAEARRYLEQGHFGSGSMLPKVLACIRFIEAGGKEAVIAELSQFKEALKGSAGTHFIP